MPSDSIHDIPAANRKALLEAMLNGPAFALFCDKFDDLVRKEVEEVIFDVKTDDAKTREMKAVRKQLTGTRHPRKIVETMIRSIYPPSTKTT